jgi:transposase-like protein
MDFPLKDYLDEQACYRKLVELLHPEGLTCPRCGQAERLGIHNRHREPVLEYQCGDCGRVFNAWTGTVLQGTHRRPRQILLILHGVATGEPTARMARELGCDRKHLLELRHRLQEHARRYLDRNPLDDAVVEADEMYQNAGEKRDSARRPGRPTATAGQPPPGPRHVRERPATDRRSGGARVGPVPLGGARPRRRG